ncbi:hypothetical protein P2G88_04760 [Aliiglaciecola sp. CAU 1673]|uniref:hypothetical protein n=1 Tax=Aliiglaciecola sp. CAU 1673 TaxID=3032595 RepID=UPI0023DB6894|nr:hypothetical protein [Aliiglaciecola sp. CAU 1673]MDF2177558.1 hypothetical protein [Aliiglaciecola sp. CAU 1673]
MTDSALKDIIRIKKELNWGELPPFFHMVSSTLGELDGLFSHGFDNAFRRIIDRRNWELERLQGEELPDGTINVKHHPRLALYRRVSTMGYEVRCFPLALDKEVDQYVKDHPLMEFKVWDPNGMRILLRVPKLVEFVHYAYTQGDKADRALVKFAHYVIERVVLELSTHVLIVKDDGQRISEIAGNFGDDFAHLIEQKLKAELKANPLSQNSP